MRKLNTCLLSTCSFGEPLSVCLLHAHCEAFSGSLSFSAVARQRSIYNDRTAQTQDLTNEIKKVSFLDGTPGCCCTFIRFEQPLQVEVVSQDELRSREHV